MKKEREREIQLAKGEVERGRGGKARHVHNTDAINFICDRPQCQQADTDINRNTNRRRHSRSRSRSRSRGEDRRGAWVHCTGTGIRTGAPWHVNAVVMLMQAVWGSQPGQDWLPTLLMNKLGLKYDPARMRGGCTS